MRRHTVITDEVGNIQTPGTIEHVERISAKHVEGLVGEATRLVQEAAEGGKVKIDEKTAQALAAVLLNDDSGYVDGLQVMTRGMYELMGWLDESSDYTLPTNFKLNADSEADISDVSEHRGEEVMEVNPAYLLRNLLQMYPQLFDMIPRVESASVRRIKADRTKPHAVLAAYSGKPTDDSLYGFAPGVEIQMTEDRAHLLVGIAEYDTSRPKDYDNWPTVKGWLKIPAEWVPIED
ncbi:hypothetical protein KRX56_06005 [Dermabacteraceae bacterium TAE3-ERU27]|nr:hypothetical protein [Dermabacteraceae bacterium TAE3-ERU27]